MSQLPSQLLPPKRRRGALLGLFVTFLLLLSGCGGSSSSLDAEAERQLEIADNGVADLAGDLGTEQVPTERLRQIISRAEEAGTDLRIVVAAPDGEFISAKAVVDRFGGTAIAYQADRTGFEGASRDLSAEQLDEAVNAAKVELDIGDSADAFVSVLERDGVESRTTSGARPVLLALLIPAALFMLWGAYSYFRARKRRIRRQVTFDQRKAVLLDWADQLRPQLDDLGPMVVASPDLAAQKTWHESNDFVSSIMPVLSEARTIGELDAAEMRISRTAIKLRDLRSSLTA